MGTILAQIDSSVHPNADELKSIDIFADLPENALAWLASHMLALDLEPGDVIVRPGDPADYMFAILSGEIRGELPDGRIYISRSGRVTGALPFSRLTQFNGTVRAVVRTRAAVLHKWLFDEMVHEIPGLQTRLVNVLSDRIRETTANDQQRDKMAALGKLSAGLAHELNNPASAARRAADSLKKALKSVRTAAAKLDREGLPQESRLFLTELERDWKDRAGPQKPLDSLERSDREEEISSWLAARHVEGVWDIASTLVDLGCTKEVLQDVERHVPAEFLNDVLVRMTAAFTISRLADEIESSTARISEMVRAVKEYSYMDQMPEQKVDIHRGIENTLLMLRHEIKNGLEIVKEYDESLPQICARGSELNQVWTNLILNARDAMSGKGKLMIRTLRDHNCVRVEVIDNGPGIPDQIKNRIFEPFFTTKAVGEGTGLGLDTVYRVVRNHGGDVSFDSRPGETRFTVRIPFNAPTVQSA